MIPFRIKITPVVELNGEAVWQRIALNDGRPLAQRGDHKYPVAVVGGGPSLLGRLDELRSWPGEIWAINSTCDWLLDQGIEATLFTVDSAPLETRAKKAILASWCVPELFDGRDAVMFHLSEHAEGGIAGGTTTATRAPMLAVKLGYPGVHFFGCDSSFEDKDHVDRHEGRAEQVIVRANGKDYKTAPDYILQLESLTMLIDMAPDVFVNKSGGLLEAALADRNWEIVAVSEGLKAHLIDQNGDTHLYDKPYVPPCKSCGQVTGHYDDCEVGLGA